MSPLPSLPLQQSSQVCCHHQPWDWCWSIHPDSRCHLPCSRSTAARGSLPYGDMFVKFFNATIMLRGPLELLLQELRPKALCIISDMAIPSTTKVAHNLGIPRFVFHGFGCFSLLAIHNFWHYNMNERLTSDLEPFSIPGLPETIKFTKAKTQTAMGIRSEFQSIRDSLLKG